MPASIEQWGACALVVASLGNYTFCSKEVLPVVDVVAACGIVACFERFERVGNRAPIRAGLALLGMRWIDSACRLVAQTDISCYTRFATIASQLGLFLAMASAGVY
jgi:hypothetical protein